MEKDTASSRNIFKQPPVQIILFGIVLCLIQFLSMKGLITSSFAFALGNTLIYAVMAIGFCLLLGYSGLASLGTAGFIGIGTYAVYYIMQQHGYPLILAFLVTLGISLGLGVVVGFISLRIEGIYLAILTLGLSEIIRNVLMAIKPTIKLELSRSRFFGLQMNDRGAYFLIVVIYCLLMWITSNLINSPTGRAMVAMKNSTSAAQAMGISLMKFRLMAFVIATVYAALGGMLYMVYVRNLTTSSSLLLTLTTSLNILGAVIIGGSKSLWGSFVGAFIIYGIQSMFLSRIPFFVKNPAFITMVTGVLIVIVVMFFPGGIAQIAAKISASIKKRKIAAASEEKGEE